LLYGEDKTDKFVKTFLDRCNSISSLLYGLQFDNKRIRFYPKPAIITVKETEDVKNSKTIRKIKYVSEGLLKELLEKYDPQTETSFFKDWGNVVKAGGSFAALKSEIAADLPAFLHHSSETKVQIDRQTGGAAEGMLYFEPFISLQKIEDKNGKKYSPFLFFLANIHSMQAEFEASARLMCDEGIGGERSQGRGIFDSVHISSFNGLGNRANSNCSYSLSLTHPTEDEFKHATAYHLVTRGGFNADTKKKEYHVPLKQQRKLVRMLSEGAVFNREIKGELVDVTPNGFTKHNIYQNGLFNGFKF
jgi:CRISPR-associated protein Csm4